MELEDLLQDINGTEMVISGTAGLVVGVISGLFDKKKSTSEAVKAGVSYVCGASFLNIEGTWGSNIAESVANIGSARIGYEIGYQAVQRLVYKNY